MDASLQVNDQEPVSTLNYDSSVEDSELSKEITSEPAQVDWHELFGTPTSSPPSMTINPDPKSTSNTKSISPLRGNDPGLAHPSPRHLDLQLSPRSVDAKVDSPLRGNEFRRVRSSPKQSDIHPNNLSSHFDNEVVGSFDENTLNEFLQNFNGSPDGWLPIDFGGSNDPTYGDFDFNEFSSHTHEDSFTNPRQPDNFTYEEPKINRWSPSQFRFSPQQVEVQQEVPAKSTRGFSIHELLNHSAPSDLVEKSHSNSIDPRVLQGSGVVRSAHIYSQADFSSEVFSDETNYAPRLSEQPPRRRYEPSRRPYGTSRDQPSGYSPQEQFQENWQQASSSTPQHFERPYPPRPVPPPLQNYAQPSSPNPRRSNARYSPRLKTMRDSQKEWIKSGPTTGANRRSKNIATYDPLQHYDPLPAPPRPWGSFNYTHYGELEENKVYTIPEIFEYLYDRPQDRPLTLWIQKIPSDSARRYPTRFSNHCRFQDCPGHKNTINIGQYRVAFDEHVNTRRHDPFHNAGYVHLWCLERYFDFPVLVGDLDIRTDLRELRKEPGGVNKMALSSLFEKDISEDFIDRCRKGDFPPDYPRYDEPDRPYPGTLNHRLTLEKVDRERNRTEKQRETRGTKPSMISEHLNDLEVQTRARAITRDVRNQTWKSRDNWRGRGNRRARDSNEDDEQESNANMGGGSGNQRATRRGVMTNQTTSRKRNNDEIDEYDSDTIVVNPSHYNTRTRGMKVNQAAKNVHDSKRRRYSDEEDQFDTGLFEPISSVRATRSSSKRVTRSRNPIYAEQDDDSEGEDDSEYCN
ncbi:hypothetical protein MMC14_000675 [Varicellaria rhodocarpa]|nr:hypothetical protein [Varicellaria rhodocarpa]